MTEHRTGPLVGLKVVELAGLGPAPFAAMFLADQGADVVRIERTGAGFTMPIDTSLDTLQRGKRMISADLKDPAGLDMVLDLIGKADVLVEGYRPGVTERLGLGPDDCWQRNPTLVYGRMTGWGQTGPLAQRAGHDPTYQALVGSLHAIGRAGGPPQLPLSLVGDFGGGAMYLVAGILAALWEANRSGRGQVVDAAIVDGVAHLMANPYSMLAGGAWNDERGTNLIDTGAPFVDVYSTSDGKHVAVAALEPPFYTHLLAGLGLDRSGDLPDQWDRRRWPELRERFAAEFATRTRDEWTSVFRDTDACVAPILSMTEAPADEHLVARGTFLDRNGEPEPAPAPRFSRTPAGIPTPPPVPGQDDRAEILAAWGLGGMPTSSPATGVTVQKPPNPSHPR
ncbi:MULTISPECIES: CaiB/BaiF CoA-transferase family protein [unclassified Rhodococcus (in: high G+C Gram-positive bacteria)]|uniref:CaiB/BaiF CoA transferase family protein n=1 Tax=unclassified Rhodococcus (in: high G+C Gram-positive bacteria) TaxID=192944 RepID=UPI001639941A|nr:MULTISPECIES: CaiB/BaiF CoA-transferase family protein [unclassified Rhodococcus (in: high G+C Gram-positive bacteria)]MBC2644221.1 CoA transferase [Rhodococcus sp. 3A]MBC2891040.1 CoA transferase [Rhodococcus sp. 4CII]